MTVTDSEIIAPASESRVDRVVDPRILEPIPGSKPTGEDIRRLPLWVDLRTARPKAETGPSDHDWQPAETVKTTWSAYKEMVEQALCLKSKDIELGLFLVEACARLHGFRGVRDGLWILCGLITEFKDKGLFPEAEDGDFEVQIGKLEWVNEKLPDVVREIPLTRRASPGANYSLNYRDESRRPNGMISAAEFEAAALAGTSEQYSELLDEIASTLMELELLKQVTAENYGAESSSYTALAETLGECRAAVKSIMSKRSPPAEKPPVAQSTTKISWSRQPMEQTSGADSWSECEHIADSGDIDGAIARMATLAAAEPNGRVRFHRKLLLADLCFKTDRKRLATSILEELNEILVEHKLESWETSEVVGGVWSRLVRCYRDSAAGTADEGKEQEFYLKLSRLDPWQALACGEPARKG